MRLPMLHTRRLVFATVSRCPAFQQLGDNVYCARQFLYLVSTHTTFDRRPPQRYTFLCLSDVVSLSHRAVWGVL
jgi:hypothetical protein